MPRRELAGKGQTDLFLPDLVHKHLQAIEQVLQLALREDETIPSAATGLVERHCAARRPR
jgi:hypothetical protein